MNKIIGGHTSHRGMPGMPGNGMGLPNAGVSNPFNMNAAGRMPNPQQLQGRGRGRGGGGGGGGGGAPSQQFPFDSRGLTICFCVFFLICCLLMYVGAYFVKTKVYISVFL